MYEFHTLAQINLDELHEALTERSETGNGLEVSERRIGNLVSEAEDSLQVGLQRFPDSARLHALEANFRDMLAQSGRAEAALRRAFELNVRQEFIAVRLARHLTKSGQKEDAVAILQKCIEGRPGAKFAHLELARMILDEETYNRETVIGHLRRSTSSGDANYFAQYLLAEQYMLDDNEEEAAKLFERLDTSAISNKEKRKTRSLWKDQNGQPKLFSGTVESVKGNFCFINTQITKRAIFSHYSDSNPASWQLLRPGKNVSFRIGFTMRGIVAHDIKIAD